jgi:hypothetical protein
LREANFERCSQRSGNVNFFVDTTMQPDPILGCLVEIRSITGIVYRGVVRSIGPDTGLGEIFELVSAVQADYQRLVHVVDRAVQIRKIAA